MVFLHDRIGWKSIVGVLSTLLGIIVLQVGWPVLLAFERSHLFGNLLAIGAAACESTFTVLARKASIAKKEKFTLTAVVHSGIVSIHALFLCLIPMFFEQPRQANFALQLDIWLALFWYGSIVTIVAFAYMFTGAKYCDCYTIAAFTGLIPVSALVLSILVLNEQVLLHHWLGCGLITFAIILMNWRKR